MRVGARASKGCLTFSVQDEGCGMSQEEAERIFAKYSSHTGGRGLGLALSKRLPERLGGELGVESAPGEGSTFWVVLPFETVPEPVGAATAAAGVPSAPPASRPRTCSRSTGSR